MLQLKHNYFIDSDGSCLKLCKKSVKHDDETNTDKETISIAGYYMDLADTLKGYTRRVTNEYIQDNDCDLKDIKSLLTELKAEVQGYGA